MTETHSIQLTVNGSAHPAIAGSTVTTLVAQLTGREISPDGRAVDGKTLGVAVAKNGEVVPRSQWSVTGVLAGDDLEIVTAVQGG